jgi:hypothetical protein
MAIFNQKKIIELGGANNFLTGTINGAEGIHLFIH